MYAGGFVWKPEEKIPLGKPTNKWEDNIKMDLKEISLGGGGRGMDLSGTGYGQVADCDEDGGDYSRFVK